MKKETEAAGLKPIGSPATLALAELIPSPGNRAVPKDDDLKGLAASIKAVGLLYPVIVRPDAEQGNVYRIVAGERRWRAMKMLKLETVPCVILDAEDDEARAEVVRVVENHQRRNLEPLEEAAAVRGLLDMGLEPKAVARSLGRSRSWVARRASLTELSERWIAEIRGSEYRFASWPPSHLEAISRFPANVQDRILDAFGSQWRRNVPGFRDLVEATGRFLRVLSAAPWKVDDATLVPEAGACSACPKRSSHAPDLFEGELDADAGSTSPGDRCLDAACWRRKAETFLTRKAERLWKLYPELLLLNNGEDDRARLEETFLAKVRDASEVVTGRKSDADAVPALVVNGPGTGRVRWVRPVDDGVSSFPTANGSSSSASNGTSEPSEGPPTKTPWEKRKPYDRRRRQIVVNSVRERLQALAERGDPEGFAELEGGRALIHRGLTVKTLFLLAATLDARGWRDQVHDGTLAFPEDLDWFELDSMRNHSVGQGPTRDAIFRLCRDLLRMTVGTLAARLCVAPGEITNLPHYEEASALCAMLGFDLTALRAEAAEAVPYAKLWRDEITDDWIVPSVPEAAEDGLDSESPAGEGSDSR